MQEYQCCFCAEAVDPMQMGVGTLIYTPSFDEPKDEQATQYLFCHARCLRKALHASVPLLEASE